MLIGQPQYKKNLKKKLGRNKKKRSKRINGEDVLEKTIYKKLQKNEIDAYLRAKRNDILDTQGIDIIIYAKNKEFFIQAKSDWQEEKMHRHFERYPDPKITLIFVKPTSREKIVDKAISDLLLRYNENSNIPLVYRISGGISYGYYDLKNKTIVFCAL